jgi:aconitase B
MFAVADVLFVLMVKAVLEVSADLDLEMAYHKMHCGTSDGRTGALNAVVWTTSQTIDFEPLDKGNMQVLGKEMDTVHDEISGREC